MALNVIKHAHLIQHCGTVQEKFENHGMVPPGLLKESRVARGCAPYPMHQSLEHSLDAETVAEQRGPGLQLWATPTTTHVGGGRTSG